jgi:hypothetical protein
VPPVDFAFTVLSGECIDHQVLSLQVDPKEMWKTWCELQTPYEFESTLSAPDAGIESSATTCGPALGYGCLPLSGDLTGTIAEAGTNTTCTATLCSGDPFPVDCEKTELCMPRHPRRAHARAQRRGARPTRIRPSSSRSQTRPSVRAPSMGRWSDSTDRGRSTCTSRGSPKGDRPAERVDANNEHPEGSNVTESLRAGHRVTTRHRHVGPTHSLFATRRRANS